MTTRWLERKRAIQRHRCWSDTEKLDPVVRAILLVLVKVIARVLGTADTPLLPL